MAQAPSSVQREVPRPIGRGRWRCKGPPTRRLPRPLDISVRTLHRWKKEPPESAADGAWPRVRTLRMLKVKRSLYQRAVGYEAKGGRRRSSLAGPGDWQAQRGFQRPVWPRSTSHPTRWRVCTGSTTGARESSLSVRKSLWGGAVKTSPMEKLTEEELRSLARMDEGQDG